jgi:murein DD-endopeptidase MepM/ murein hydrolase activator NlpD
MYGHLNKINPRFSEGDMINAGQRLGQVGSTGWSTGPHLHFGVSKGGEYVNPSRFFSGQLRGGNPSQQQPAQQRSNRKNVNDALKNTGRDFSHILQNLGL